MPEGHVKYNRVLLKLSGEALMGDQSFGIDPDMVANIAREISDIHRLGIEIGIVVGGGNIFRGLQSAALGVERVVGDHMGMLATVINSLALGEALSEAGVNARVMTAIDMIKIAQPFTVKDANIEIGKKRVVIFGAGTGNPFFTTDTAAALRAMEINADVLLKATKVDGVYERDPELDSSLRPFTQLTYDDVIKKELKVMDLTAISLAKDQALPIIVFNIRKKGNISKVIFRQNIGTLITGVNHER